LRLRNPTTICGHGIAQVRCLLKLLAQTADLRKTPTTAIALAQSHNHLWSWDCAGPLFAQVVGANSGPAQNPDQDDCAIPRPQSLKLKPRSYIKYSDMNYLS